VEFRQSPSKIKICINSAYKTKKNSKRAKGPEWLMSNNDKEKSLGVYLTIETIGYEKKATELPIIMMGKWLEANLPGTLEAKPMRDGRLLVLAKNEESAAKATKNLKNFCGTCKIKTTRMENKFIYNLAKYEANELQAIKDKRLNTVKSSKRR
jgi:hypothetical protein